MSRKSPKSFRLNDEDRNKLNKVHEYYKSKYNNQIKDFNMNNLYKWSEAQTIAVLIRDRYEELVEQDRIER